MDIISLTSITIGFISYGYSIYLVFSANIIQISGNNIALTTDGQFAICGIIVGTFAFIFSIWCESHQLLKGTTKSRQELDGHYQAIASKLGVNPMYSSTLKNHFKLLKQINEIRETYEERPALEYLITGYVKLCFNNIIDIELGKCKNHLDNAKMELESKVIRLHHDFIDLCCEAVRQNGKIYFTSIVKPPPGGFWQNTHRYLETQRKIAISKKADIVRYFILVQDHENSLNKHKEVLNANITNNVDTRIALYKNKDDAGTCYKDLVLVDDLLANYNIIENGIIVKAVCYFEHDINTATITDIKGTFIDLENCPNLFKVKDYTDFDTFINAVKNGIRKL